MSVTDDLFDLISPGTMDLISERIYVQEPAENYTYVGPYIVISGIPGQSEEDLTGGIGIANERFTFSCRASKADGGHKTCRQLADLVRIAIQGVAPSDDLTIQSAESQGGGAAGFDLDLSICYRDIDFDVMYSEQPTAAA